MTANAAVMEAERSQLTASLKSAADLQVQHEEKEHECVHVVVIKHETSQERHYNTVLQNQRAFSFLV